MTTDHTKYHLFIDESGDHGLTTLNTEFPVFLLCGVLISEPAYQQLRKSFNEVKTYFWKDKKVIFHSRDIRKCEKEFQILFDLELKAGFYDRLNKVLRDESYTVISSAIRKDHYIKKFGCLSNDVYELALSFMVERSVFYLDAIKGSKSLDMVIEKRGKKEDKQLHEHFQRLVARGTGYVAPERLRNIGLNVVFKDKRENINGLQLADLIAYPMARYVIDPQRANPAFDVIEPKIYAKGGRRYGLKVFP